MEILETQVYPGANYWAPVPVIRLVLDIGALTDRPTNKISGFCERLFAVVPTLGEHPCSIGKAGGLLQQVREGIGLPHVAEHLALELQSLAGECLRYRKTPATTAPGEDAALGGQQVIFQYQEQAVGIAAGKLAVRLLESFVGPDRDTNFDFASQLENLIQLAKGLRYGIDTRKLVEEARSRGIPVEHLDETRGAPQFGSGSRRRLSLLQLGYGKFQQRIWTPYISADSFIAAEIACNKGLTNHLLRSAGLPAPHSIAVTSEEAAVAAAREVGYPLVVKPLDSSQGRGVGVHLENDAAVRAQYPLAVSASPTSTVLVEKFIAGRHYRILVVGGRFVAAAERVPAYVTGDGSHTLRQLVDLANADPARASKHKARIAFDDRAIALAQRQGYNPDNVPPARQRVQMVLTANISTGGTSVDCTDHIHTDNVAIAEQAAQVIGLDLAGIDLIAPDISKPVLETGGAICEVNGGPGLFVVHSQPVEGQSREVIRPVIDRLFPPGAPSRIPIVAVTGTNGTTITSRIISHILKLAGRHVGLATTEGLDIDGVWIVRGDMSGPDSARKVLRNPAIDAAVLETGHKGILCSGLGYDRADVAVVTGIGGGEGLPGIGAAETLARLSAVVARSISERGVTALNADDNWCVRIAGETHGEVIYFSLRPDNGVIGRHLRGGGRALVLRSRPDGDALSLIDGAETNLLLAREIPGASAACACSSIANALAATAACVGLGIDIGSICRGLRTFAWS
jgi:cyanophycin synthetase